MDFFTKEDEYLKFLEEIAVLPEGFKTASVPLKFFPKEKVLEKALSMNLSLIALDEPTRVFAGTFTRNRFAGAPVLVGRERLKSEFSQGVIINNKIANVCTANGVEDSRSISRCVAEHFGVDESYFFPSSTGVIGWQLPVKEILDFVPKVVKALDGGSLLDTAKGIMTTDAFPKIRRVDVGDGSIVVVAKGAGMIEPNMATMLCYVLTDVKVSREDLQAVLSDVVDRTFNRISVDSDQSTSDTVLAFSSCKKAEVSIEDFRAALFSVCNFMAEDIVRNGEGTEHVIKVRVCGAVDEKDAVGVGKAVVNSPLVKTAICGNDPNVGRILSSIGDYYSNCKMDLDVNSVSVQIGDKVVFDNGVFVLDNDKEVYLSDYMKSVAFDNKKSGFPQNFECVEILVSLPFADGQAEVVGSDLTHGYVSENADYRS